MSDKWTQAEQARYDKHTTEGETMSDKEQDAEIKNLERRGSCFGDEGADSMKPLVRQDGGDS